MKAAPHRAREKTFIDLEGGAPKTSIFDEKSVKVTFSRCYAGFHPTFWAAGPLTSKNHQGVRSRPAVREYWTAVKPARSGHCPFVPKLA